MLTRTPQPKSGGRSAEHCSARIIQQTGGATLRAPKLLTSMLALIAAIFITSVAVAAPSITNLRCESRVTPLGVDAPQPRLSWILESSQRGARQTAYQIVVASSEKLLAAGQGDLWDSGKVVSSETIGIPYVGKGLRSGQRCHWKVRVWDAANRPAKWSRAAWWEMGLLQPADWSGKWINDGRANPTNDAAFYADDPAPLFRRELKLTKPVRRARLYISGLGYYEASLNGRRIGDQVLDPGWTMFGKRVYYSTYDVTAGLRRGDNCLGVTLGNGWWNPLPLRMWGHINLRERLAIGRPRFIAQLNVEFADGTTQSFASDESWRVAPGPILRNSVYLGEVYDARRKLPGWDKAGFDDRAWATAAPATEVIGELQAQPQPPIRVRETLRAVRVTEPQPGVFIYDFGENFSGWAAFRFRATAGTKIQMRYGELLHADGTLNPLTSVAGQIKRQRKNKAGVLESVGGPGAPAIAWQEDTYIARGGGEESYVPRFTFHGFRYVEVTGLSKALPLSAVTGMKLASDVPNAGEFACSNPMFNQLQAVCRRTFLANLFSVQSDCAHREKFGYGGDIVATSEAFMMNFDMEQFYAKTAADFGDSAYPDGMFPDTAPGVGIKYCGVGWGMAHPLLLAQLHQHYGNRRVTEEQYAAAARWLRYLAGQFPEGMATRGLSDHESLEETPAPQMVTPLYFQSARLIAGLARLQGNAADAAEFDALAEKIQRAYLETYFDAKSGRVDPGTQGSQAYALYSDILPQPNRPAALAYLVDNIRGEHQGHISAGITGTKFMLEELSRAGHAATAYTVVAQTNYPGWGWMLANGATTLWESWEGGTNVFTHCHPMFGSVSQWFLNWLGGIQPQRDAVGFDRIVIRPQVVGDLRWVRSSYDSVRGRIVSNWTREKGRLRFEIEIPANTTAEIFLPAASADKVTEGGRRVTVVRGIKLLRQEAGAAVFAVGSGRYRFEISE